MRPSLSLLVLGAVLAWMTCFVGADGQCFKKDGGDIKLGDSCTKGDVNFELSKQSFLVEISAPGFTDTKRKDFKLTVGGHGLEGSLWHDGTKLSIGFGKAGKTPLWPSSSVILTAEPSKLTFVDSDNDPLSSIPCTVKFESKDGKYYSSLGIDLTGGPIGSLVVVIKDAIMQDSNEGVAGAQLPWWVILLFVAVVVSVAVAIAVLGWCLYRHNKDKKAKAKQDVEAQTKDEKPETEKPDASKPKEADKPNTNKPEGEAKKSSGSDEKKPGTESKVDEEASQTKVNKYEKLRRQLAKEKEEFERQDTENLRSNQKWKKRTAPRNKNTGKSSKHKTSRRRLSKKDSEGSARFA